MAHVGGVKAGEDDGVKNMAAWLLGIKTLKIQPYHLPPLGNIFLLLPLFLPAKCIQTHDCLKRVLG